MKKTDQNNKFQINDELIDNIINLIDNSDNKRILKNFNELHHADIAEILEELTSDQATYIIKLLDSEKTSDILMELDDDLINDCFGKNKLFNCFVAEVNSKIEGMAIVYNRYSTWKGETLHLEDLIVTKNMRNMGIGALLLDKVILFGKEMGVKRITWEVIDWNKKAIKFYERKGAKLIDDWSIIHLNEEAIKNYH